MSKELTDDATFTPEIPVRAVRHPMTGAELITVATLTVSIVIAATAVSIGIARAEANDTIAGPETSMAFLMIIGLVLAGMVGLTALATRDRSTRR